MPGEVSWEDSLDDVLRGERYSEAVSYQSRLTRASLVDVNSSAPAADGREPKGNEHWDKQESLWAAGPATVSHH